MRSDFENHFRKTLFYSNMLSSAAESGIAIEPFEKARGQYRNAYVQLAYSVYSHQQIKVDELKSTIEKQKKLSLKAIENAKAGSGLELQLAQKLHSESSPDSLESERAMNALLTNENLLLESRVVAFIQIVNRAKTGDYGLNQDGADIESFIFDLEQALKGESND